MIWGNKSDLESERVVTEDEGIEEAERLSAGFIEN